jgi:hypothetical protein
MLSLLSLCIVIVTLNCFMFVVRTPCACTSLLHLFFFFSCLHYGVLCFFTCARFSSCSFAPLVACFSMPSWFFCRITLSSSSYALSKQHFFILCFVYWNSLFIRKHNFFHLMLHPSFVKVSFFHLVLCLLESISFFSSSLWFAKSSTIVFFEQHCQLRLSTSFHH